MRTYETITLTIPVEEGYSFASLREHLSEFLSENIPASTLYDWIKNICLLRRTEVYSSFYTFKEVECLLTWTVFRRSCKRGTAAKNFRKYLQEQLENQNATN